MSIIAYENKDVKTCELEINKAGKRNEEEIIGEIRKSENIAGEEPDFLEALKNAETYAPGTEPILLIGETGTGKEVFANYIHKLCTRLHRRVDTIFRLNCACLSESLIESELFGYKKGAFTGANSDKKGIFENADKGTLFLDEIQELDKGRQGRLLRVLTNNIVVRIGDAIERKVDVRLIAATSLEEMLRGEIFERFSYIIRIPSLRNRKNDIPLLAKMFLKNLVEKNGIQKQWSSEALAKLRINTWDKNIRQLKNVVTRTYANAKGIPSEEISPDEIRFDTQSGEQKAVDALNLPDPHEGFVLNEFVQGIREKMITKAIEKAKNNKSEAARLLGLTPQALHQYLKNK
ncbi:MAG: sigma-54-dependent Fis family transcriptional regulator [Planctomycetes bacterium]|nr:sigma-54-dependent Fis family transcriptional regulator [Planctomycetota bacterium]